MSGLALPSYRSGFASPQRGRMLYPSLWRDCVGAWCPALGQSGAMLFDHSLYRNHGVLTSMEVASDWIVSGGRMALDFAVGDYVSIPNSPIISTIPFVTWSVWHYDTLAPSTPFYTSCVFSKQEPSYPYPSIDMRGVSATEWQFAIVIAGTERTISGGSIDLNSWTHTAITYDGAALTTYKNGLLVASAAYAGTVGGTSYELRIGANTHTPSRYYTGLVDDFRVYRRALSSTDIWLLARERGIAYRSIPREFWVYTAPAANRRRRALITAG